MTNAKRKASIPLRQPKLHESASPAHPDLERSIEVVITNPEGDVIGRTGIRVSPVESRFITAHGHDWDYFRLSFAPAIDAEIPVGCEWNAEAGCWDEKGGAA
jgi:hypothetical protein